MMRKRFKYIVILMLLSYISSTHAMVFISSIETSDQPHCQQMNILQEHQQVNDQADKNNNNIEKCLKHCANIVTMIAPDIDATIALLNSEQPTSEPAAFISFHSDIIKQPPKHG